MFLSVSRHAFSLSLVIPSVAASNPNDTVLIDAYISFSERLDSMGISATTCLEDFIRSYKGTSNTLQIYVDHLIDIEVAIATEAEIMVAYNQQHTVKRDGADIEPHSTGGQWYDNIGNTYPRLPCAASYSNHNLLSTVSQGDIIQETSGGVATVTGHIAIVQGQYWDTNYNQFYIRTVEAVPDGVSYGVLDDTRYDHRLPNIYYISSATTMQKADAVAFCVNQLGKGYALDIPLLSSCNYSSSTKNWYCSELVWAAYYNQGINLNGNSIPLNIYMPKDLAASSKLTKRSIS